MGFMDTMSEKMEASFVPLATKLNSQRHVAAVRDAFTLCFPLTLTGSLITIINYAILSKDGFVAKLLHLSTLFPNLEDGQKLFAPIMNGTINIMSLLIVFLTAYKLAESMKGDKILSAICAVGVYYIVYPPYIDGALPMTFMGTQGLFVALIVGILVGEVLTRLSRNKKLCIKMPDSVPPAVAQSFNLVIPIMIIFVVSAAINFVLSKFIEGGIQYLIFEAIQKPFQNLGGNIFTILILLIVQQFLWMLGIHGPNTLAAVRSVMFAGPDATNIAFYAAAGTTIGTDYPLTWCSIGDSFASTGGSGATLGLLIAIFLVGRSDKTQTSIAKLAFAPGLFNVNEPLMFGLPIVMNPVYFIPFILSPVVCSLIGYVSTIVLKIIPPATLYTGWTTPGFLMPFLGSGGQNYLSLVIGILCVAVSTLIYIPFVKVAVKANQKENV